MEPNDSEHRLQPRTTPNVQRRHKRLPPTSEYQDQPERSSPCLHGSLAFGPKSIGRSPSERALSALVYCLTPYNDDICSSRSIEWQSPPLHEMGLLNAYRTACNVPWPSVTNVLGVLKQPVKQSMQYRCYVRSIKSIKPILVWTNCLLVCREINLWARFDFPRVRVGAVASRLGPAYRRTQSLRMDIA